MKSRRGHGTLMRAVCSGALLISFGCSATNTSEDEPDSASEAMLEPSAEASIQKAAESATSCDILDPTNCLLPFPSSKFLASDEDTETGERVSFNKAAMPSNSDGIAIDPTNWNRNDGFSPMTPILAYFDRIDPVASRLVPQGAIEASMADDSNSLLIDLTDGVRLPHWVEMDAQTDDPARRLTIMRPAVALPEGHRIAVVYRNLVTDRQQDVTPPAAFLAIRDRLTASSATVRRAIDQRRVEIDPLLDSLVEFGVQRSEVTLAWDFSVASAASLAGPLLSMRDDAWKRIGFDSPIFGVTDVVEDPAKLPEGIGRIVHGVIKVPSYLTGKGGPGEAALRDASGMPKYAGSTIDTPFSCVLTNRQLGRVSGVVEPALAVVYGHGLLGSHTEVERSDLAASAVAQNFMHCATDWLGMSTGDAGAAIGALSDLTKMGPMVDRMMQGILAQLVLARVMKHPSGFAKHPAFQPCNGPANAFCPFPPVSTIAPDEVYYDGNSQGGIMGAAATAVSTEWTKATLGVPGMAYSMLLNRSSDWTTYEAVMDPAYPDPIVQQIIFGLMQMLWDRGEAAGYIHHLTEDPLPNTPEHQVILEVAFGDFQVANVTADIMARTADIAVHDPLLADGRSSDAAPFYDLTPIQFYPARTSAMFYWDSGTIPPPLGNINPKEAAEYVGECDNVDTDRCRDPHEDPRDQPAFWEQKRVFFESGTVIDPCAGAPCTAKHGG